MSIVCTAVSVDVIDAGVIPVEALGLAVGGVVGRKTSLRAARRGGGVEGAEAREKVLRIVANALALALGGTGGGGVVGRDDILMELAEELMGSGGGTYAGEGAFFFVTVSDLKKVHSSSKLTESKSDSRGEWSSMPVSRYGSTRISPNRMTNTIQKTVRVRKDRGKGLRTVYDSD